MMLQCKLTILFTTFFLASFAQGNDTSVFFRYAATFDYLLPLQGEPFTHTVPDSTAEQGFNAELKNARLHKIVKLKTVTEQESVILDLHQERMEWDASKRLTRHALYLGGESRSIKETRINYISGKKISYLTVRNEYESIAPDTLFYTYNRSGWINNWRRHDVNVTGELITTGNRLYDSRGNLIVATYMMYGPLLGAYTYEYNTRNQLVRRCFTTASGAVLCTDTIEYGDLMNSIQLITHKLKVSGSDKWMTVETKTLSNVSGKVLTYSDYNDADTSYFYKNLPSYSLTYEYDDKGRIVSEVFGNAINPSLITAKYEYGIYDQPDAIEYSEQYYVKKQLTSRIYSRDERKYDELGRIKSRDITTYLFEEMKKKSTFVPTEVVQIEYIWE